MAHLNADGNVVLEGDGTYPFSVVVDTLTIPKDWANIDLKVYKVRATWWDDKQTASGRDASIRGLFAVSLPMSYDPACHGSPYVRFPWDTSVDVYSHKNGAVLRGNPLLDVGPQAPDGPAGATGEIDLTPALYKACGGDPIGAGDPGHILVDYRIKSGAAFLTVLQKQAVTDLLSK